MKQLSIVTHLAAAITITAVMLLIYVCVQQSYRSSANDPQLQIARDLRDDLSHRKINEAFLRTDTIDIAQSLAVFTELFDANGKAIQSTGFLDGKLPQPPDGVFEFTRANMEDVLTWQPRSGVRMAMVFEKIDASDAALIPKGALEGEGFIAAGRSLTETEIRVSNLVKMITMAWIACLSVLLVHLLIQGYYREKLTKKPVVYEN